MRAVRALKLTYTPPAPAITCLGCSTELGWTYVRPLPLSPISSGSANTRSVQYEAPEQSQRYKEGKTILEKVSGTELRRLSSSLTFLFHRRRSTR